MKRIFALAAAFALSGSIAFAAITADDVVKTYQDAGYTRIEVTTGQGQVIGLKPTATRRVRITVATAKGRLGLAEVALLRP